MAAPFAGAVSPCAIRPPEQPPASPSPVAASACFSRQTGLNSAFGALTRRCFQQHSHKGQGRGYLENYIFQVTKELVGILWEKEKAYYCSCRKLVSNPQDAEIAAESWMEQGDPKLQPTSHGIFPNALREKRCLCHSHTGKQKATSHPPPKRRTKSALFLASSFRVGRTPVKLLGLPGTGSSCSALLWYRQRTEPREKGAKCSRSVLGDISKFQFCQIPAGQLRPSPTPNPPTLHLQNSAKS